ncbi:hypothetical protein ABTK11_21775, partial [Acinetobacter baumannii]
HRCAGRPGAPEQYRSHSPSGSAVDALTPAHAVGVDWVRGRVCGAADAGRAHACVASGCGAVAMSAACLCGASQTDSALCPAG